MAVAEITFDYGQVLALARQLPRSDRQRLSVDVLSEPEERSFDYWLSRIGTNVDLSNDEVLAECDAVREKLYREAN